MGKTTLVKENSLMQPFLPGSPGGRGKGGDGKAKRIPSWRWKSAFPDCKFNKYLEDDEENATDIHPE